MYFGAGNPRFEYNLKDHLGNTRITFADLDGDESVDASEILQEHHYYPFGMEMEGDWRYHPGRASDYMYNGKELNEDLGLNWLDYGARWYDPSIGRFTGVDPISDQFPHVSTYNYAENSPIANIDLHGLQAVYAADGRLLGYSVQRGQGPTQISQDLRSNGVDVPWTSIVDNNRAYFNHITERRYDRFNQAYTVLNMNAGDYIDLSFLNSQYQSTGPGQFDGSGTGIYNEASRIVRQATFQDDDNPFSARDLIGVNPLGGGLGGENSYTKSRLSEGFTQRSGSIYDGVFSNEELGVDFRLTLQDGGERPIGTPFMGIYGNQRRSRAPNVVELGHNPFAYTVNLPIRSGGVLGSQPLILQIGFRTEEARNQFFETSTSSR